MTETTGIAMMSEPWDSEDVISPTTQRIMDHVEVNMTGCYSILTYKISTIQHSNKIKVVAD